MDAFFKYVFSSKNFIIIGMVSILAGLNLLGLDFKLMSDMKYNQTVLVVTNILLQVVMFSLYVQQTKKVEDKLSPIKDIQVCADVIKDQQESLFTILEDVGNVIEATGEVTKRTYNFLQGIPNRDQLMKMVTYRTQALREEIFVAMFPILYNTTGTAVDLNLMEKRARVDISRIVKSYTYDLFSLSHNFVSADIAKQIEDKASADLEQLFLQLRPLSMPEEKAMTVDVAIRSFEQAVIAMLENDVIRLVQEKIIMDGGV